MAATWSGVSLKHVTAARARVGGSSAINCFKRLTLPVTMLRTPYFLFPRLSFPYFLS